MSLTLATEYALWALVALARHPEKQMRVADIARSENISSTYLNKIFQKLAKYKIVSTKSGVKGGIKLSRMPEKITLKEIIEAVQGSNIVKNIRERNKNDKNSKHAQLQKYLAEAEEQLAIYFRRATLKDLLTEKSN